jgi:ATP-dependent helicase/nuclease subunit B
VSRATSPISVHGLLTDETVRTGGATQPRLRILGAIEARLVRADRMILAGLEEGVWPNAAPTDPFLSRPMRQTLGLPPPERRLGQTAQDFVQAACADEAILVHSERRGGQPAVKSRWLWRLEMLTRGADMRRRRPSCSNAPPHRRRWDRPGAGCPAARDRRDYAPRPAPTPARSPASARAAGDRGRTLGARSLRRLRPAHSRIEKLDRPGASAEAMARGNAVHRAIERVVLSPGPRPCLRTAPTRLRRLPPRGT